jgi:hypothetical protein
MLTPVQNYRRGQLKLMLTPKLKLKQKLKHQKQIAPAGTCRRCQSRSMLTLKVSMLMRCQQTLTPASKQTAD